MIFGIGTDIVEVSRIEKLLEKDGLKFAEKILTFQELMVFKERNLKSKEKGVRYVATRFAAKEAFSKALGTGFRAPMTWHSIQITNNQLGAPKIELSNALADFSDMEKITSHISLSDEKSYVIAYVILECN